MHFVQLTHAYYLHIFSQTRYSSMDLAVRFEHAFVGSTYLSQFFLRERLKVKFPELILRNDNHIFFSLIKLHVFPLNDKK